MATVRILHEIQISPSPSLPSQPPQPLSFLDSLWLQNSRPMEKLFFYDFPHPTSHFIDHHLSIFTKSLSLTLHHFYLLAGSIRRCRSSPVSEHQFEIAYEEGDCITATVAEFSGDIDFHNISGHHPKNFKNLCFLVPNPIKLTAFGQFPPISIQITIFPNQGLCIGFAINHSVCDGFGTKLFIKSWTAACHSSNNISPPFLDRSVIIDSHGIRKQIFTAMSRSNEILQAEQDYLLVSNPILLHGTFTLNKNQILRLKQRVQTKQVEEGKPSYHLSAFVVTCAYVWRCLVKARGFDGEINRYFGAVVNWRSRMRPPISSNYFGNCLGAFLMELKATELVGSDGFEMAAMEIGKSIDGLQGRDVGEVLKVVLDKYPEVAGRNTLTVSGSPKLRAYEVDFGWGRPVKVDIISIIETGAISLAESREDDGGIEIGLVLSEEEMNKFQMNFATTFLDL